MKIPRDIHGRDFANHLIRRWEFREVRQTGSHIVLRTQIPSGYTVSIPAHKPMRVGTLKDAIASVANHKRVDIAQIIAGL